MLQSPSSHTTNWQPFPGRCRRKHHSFRRQFRGNGLRTALDKATSKAQKAISRWPQASRLPEALAHLPNRVPGLAITKSKQHDGSSYFAGTFTTPEGCVFCWTRTVVFVKDPWYVVRFTIEKCKNCPTPPPPTATPTPTATTTLLRLRHQRLLLRQHQR